MNAKQKMILEKFQGSALEKVKNYKRPAPLALEKLENIGTMSAMDLLKTYGIHICEHNPGDKMENMHSISTNCLVNPICISRMLDGDSICSNCFASTQQTRYVYQSIANAVNTVILTDIVIPEDMLPEIIDLMFRIESFGDISNCIQVLNYFNLCIKNAATRFALWTKNPEIIAAAMEKYGLKKPDNLRIVYSSPKRNIVDDVREKFPFIDKIFTVYDKFHYNPETMETYDGHIINCGFKKCSKCRSCYFDDNTVFIYEAVK